MSGTTRQEQIGLKAVMGAFAVAYALIGLFKHWHYESSAYDLGIFDQVIWRLSRFEAPLSSIQAHVNVFSDHFHPIIAVLAPLYWIAPRAETLIVAQSLLLAGSIWPVHAFARRRLPAGESIAIAVVYALFWGIQRTAWFDFHELAFAPLLIGIAINAIDERRWRVLWPTCVALCLVKEDMIPLVTGMGVWIAVFVDRRKGLLLAAASLLAFAIVIKVVIPAFGSGAWNFEGSFARLRAEPWLAPILAMSPPRKLVTVLFWLAPFMFLPLGSRWSLLAVVVALERLASDTPAHWGWGNHYSAPLAPILAVGAADTLSRIRAARLNAPQHRWLIPTLLTLMIAASATIPGHQPVLRLFRAKHYAERADREAAKQALAQIPADASVTAQAGIVPHLTHRDRIYLLQAGAPEADYLIAASSRLSPWPLSDPADVERWIAQRRASGYLEVFSNDGWVVLKRSTAR